MIFTVVPQGEHCLYIMSIVSIVFLFAAVLIFSQNRYARRIFPLLRTHYDSAFGYPFFSDIIFFKRLCRTGRKIPQRRVACILCKVKGCYLRTICSLMSRLRKSNRSDFIKFFCRADHIFTRLFQHKGFSFIPIGRLIVINGRFFIKIDIGFPISEPCISAVFINRIVGALRNGNSSILCKRNDRNQYAGNR